MCVCVCVCVCVSSTQRVGQKLTAASPCHPSTYYPGFITSPNTMHLLLMRPSASFIPPVYYLFLIHAGSETPSFPLFFLALSLPHSLLPLSHPQSHLIISAKSSPSHPYSSLEQLLKSSSFFPYSPPPPSHPTHFSSHHTFPSLSLSLSPPSTTYLNDVSRTK